MGAATPRIQVGLGYDSVGGLDKPIQLMRELIELPLRFPELWSTAGVPTPKGVLLHGPPGCGEYKTYCCCFRMSGACFVF